MSNTVDSEAGNVHNVTKMLHFGNVEDTESARAKGKEKTE